MNPSPEARALQRDRNFFIERRSLRRRILDRGWPITSFALALALLITWWWFK